VDYTVRDPRALERRFGHVLNYLARVELEVDRNVLELTTMLPDPPEVDRYFYADVWQPQEIRHGLILDRLQVELGRTPAAADTTTVGAAFQDVVRALYHLTGMATERSGPGLQPPARRVAELGEDAVAQTAVVPIRRQEPGHYAFYQLSARGLWAELAAWQRWLVRRLRSRSFGPVGTNDAAQRADFGDVVRALGIEQDLARFASRIARRDRAALGPPPRPGRSAVRPRRLPRRRRPRRGAPARPRRTSFTA
jgi:hypothetical protein